MLWRGALHCRCHEGKCLAVHHPSGDGGIQDASLRRLLPTLSHIPYFLIGCASSLWLFFDGSAGIEAAADRFSALPAAALTLQAVVTVDNGGLALTFALVERKISPSGGNNQKSRNPQ